MYHHFSFIDLGVDRIMKNTSWKLLLIIIGTIVAIILMCVFVVQSSQNKAISLQEAVYTAQSDIKVQEMARVSKVYNLADCVKSYSQHESETLTSLAESMSKGNDVENVQTAIAAVTYAYPDIKSSENYQILMKDLVLIENTLAQYRENYNNCVNQYNRYVKGFPTRIFLSWTGYEKKEFQRLDYQAPVEAPSGLFE